MFRKFKEMKFISLLGVKVIKNDEI